jgi:folate-binding protein YgfZ
VTGQPELVLPVSWPGLEGVDLLGPPPDDGVDRWVSDAVTRCPAGVWEAARIEAGIPVNGREVNESTIAAEVGLVDRTVSFTKGCFTGQELVARLDARGSKVARHLWGVVIDGGRDDRIGGGAPRSDTAATLVGSVVHTADGQHEVGLVTSAAWSPGFHRVVALATLHRRVEPPDDVLVAWERPGRATTKLPAEARPLPLVAT